jgi:hypothetical protein
MEDTLSVQEGGSGEDGKQNDSNENQAQAQFIKKPQETKCQDHTTQSSLRLMMKVSCFASLIPVRFEHCNPPIHDFQKFTQVLRRVLQRSISYQPDSRSRPMFGLFVTLPGSRQSPSSGRAIDAAIWKCRPMIGLFILGPPWKNNQSRWRTTT